MKRDYRSLLKPSLSAIVPGVLVSNTLIKNGGGARRFSGNPGVTSPATWSG
jgi:hypothetical protein